MGTVTSRDEEGEVRNFMAPEQTPRQRPRRLLIVDDEAGVRAVLDEYLSACGFEVCALASGREALNELKRRPQHYDLALIDWNLPGISGRDVILDLKERSPSTVVFLATGEYNCPSASNRPDAPWVDVFFKPFSLQALARRLKDVHISETRRLSG